MLNLSNVGKAFRNAKGVFIDITPAPPNIFIGKPKKVAHILFTGLFYSRFIKNAHSKKPSDICGALLAATVVDKVYRSPIKHLMLKGFELNTHKSIRSSGYTSLNERHLKRAKKTWFSKPGKLGIKIIYHVGNKRGAHIDVHFSNGTSFVIDVRNKPIASLIKTNKDGQLTQNSIKILMNHIINEFDGNGNGSRVFQNFDHNIQEAEMEWFGKEQSPDGYGSGSIRQIIHESECHVMWHNNDSSGQATSIYMPGISPDRYVYFHKLYTNNDVAKMGFKAFKTPNFQDRLHLKMVDEKSFKKLVDPSANTFKYDGASSYIEISKHGTRFFSPRISSKTDHRIEYTGKMPTNIINVKSDINYKGMGELLFLKNGKYLSSTEIGGLLNSNSVIPEDVDVEYRLYRVDSIGKKDIRSLSFFENRSIAEGITKLFPSKILTPELISLKDAKSSGAEGVVGILPQGNVFNGIKVKFKDNLFDWKIDKVKLKRGPTGAMAGVIECISEESGKRFKLGPSQIGEHSLSKDIMINPDNYLGKIIRVDSFRGHEGRAAKVIDFHLDKGIG